MRGTLPPSRDNGPGTSFPSPRTQLWKIREVLHGRGLQGLGKYKINSTSSITRQWSKYEPSCCGDTTG